MTFQINMNFYKMLLLWRQKILLLRNSLECILSQVVYETKVVNHNNKHSLDIHDTLENIN